MVATVSDIYVTTNTYGAEHVVREATFEERRAASYIYDFMNRLVKVDDTQSNLFDEVFAYDAQGRIVSQRRAAHVDIANGGASSFLDDISKDISRDMSAENFL